MRSSYSCSAPFVPGLATSPVCEYEDISKANFLTHIDENHVQSNVNLRELQTIRASFTNYKCSVCDRLESSRAEMLQHMKATERCRKMLTAVSAAAGPLGRMRRGRNGLGLPKIEETKVTTKKKKESSTEKRYIYCPESGCGFKTGIQWNLKVHLGTHLNTKYICTLCDETKKTKFSLNEHIRSTHRDKADSEDGRYDMRTGAGRWVDQYTRCHCARCDTTDTVRGYDEHLERVHRLPPLERIRSV